MGYCRRVRSKGKEVKNRMYEFLGTRDRWILFTVLPILVLGFLGLGWMFDARAISLLADAIIASVALFSLYVAWNRFRLRETHGIRVTWEELADEEGHGETRRVLVTNTGKNLVTIISGVFQVFDRVDDEAYRFQVSLQGTQTPIPSGETKEAFELHTQTTFHGFRIRKLTYIDSEGNTKVHTPSHSWPISTPPAIQGAKAKKAVNRVWERFGLAEPYDFITVTGDEFREKSVAKILSKAKPGIEGDIEDLE